MLSGHKGWVLCVEWEAMERKLATGGHDGYVRTDLWSLDSHELCYIGAIMGSEDWQIYRRSLEGPYKMDNFPIMGANSHARRPL